MSRLPIAKKSLGQHWLEDSTSLSKMIKAGDVTSEDTVLEIGAGTGTLTEELMKTGALITALEFDRERYSDLRHKYQTNKNIRLQKGDIRKFDFSSLSRDYKIIANIPYYLTANILRILAEVQNKPKIAVLLVQKEVAQRVASKPGDLSLVAVFTQLVYRAELGDTVPAQLFVPPPKVDSQILILRRHDNLNNKIDSRLEKIIKAGFSQKRKKLVNNLVSNINISRKDVMVAFDKAKLDYDVRAQELTLGQWNQLSKIFSVD